MSVLLVLVPVAFLGFIFWGVVGVRQRSTEPATMAGVAAFYAQIITIVALTAALLGAATGIKALLAVLDLRYSYGGSFASGLACPTGATESTCPVLPASNFTPQRTADVVVAGTLLVVGITVATVHHLIARAVRRRSGGGPAWVRRGATLAYATLYGFAALFGLVAGGYAIVSYFVVPKPSPAAASLFGPSGGQPFGDLAGVALCFGVAWVVALVMLFRLMPRVPVPPAVV